MGYLAHGCGTVCVDPASQFTKVRHNDIVAGIKIAVGGRGVSRDQRAAPEHRKTNAPFGLFFVVELISFLGQAAF